jgi:hypothetical protein
MDEMETLSLEAEFTEVFLLLCVGWDLQRGMEFFRRRLAAENFAVRASSSHLMHGGPGAIMYILVYY